MCNIKISSIIHDCELLKDDECTQLAASIDELFGELVEITKEACNEIEKDCLVNW